MIYTERHRGVGPVLRVAWTAIAWLLAGNVVAQTTTPVRQEWQILLADVEANRPINRAAICRVPRDQLVDLIEEGLKNSNGQVRHFVSDFALQSVQRLSRYDDTSRRIVRAAVMALRDEPDGERLDRMARRLAMLPRDAFDAETRRVIQEMVVQSSKQDGLLSLAGTVDTEEVRNKLRQAHAAGKYDALVGLARLGEPGMTDEFLRRLQESNDPEYIVRSLDELLRVRRPEVLPLLLKYVNSDDARPSHGDYVGTRYAEPAAGVLAQVVEGVPLEHIDSPNWNEVQKVRQWLKEHPDLKVIP